MRREWLPSAREALLWLLLLVGVLNFAPALFEGVNLSEEPTWRKALKDLPLVLLIAYGVLAGRRREPVLAVVDRRLRALTIAIAALAAIMLVDAAVRRPDAFGLAVSARYYVGYPLLVLALWRLAPTGRELDRFFKGVCVVGALAALVAVLSVFDPFGRTYYSGYVIVGGRELARAIGTLGNPDNLGLFLGLPAMLLLWARPFARRWNVVLLCCVLAGMVLSLSRTAAIAFVGASLIMLLRRRRRRAVLPVAALLLASAAFMYLTFAVRFRGRVSVSTLLGSRTESIGEGLERWTSSATTVLFGEGYGTLSAVSGSEITQTVTDSMLVGLALEGGIVALLAFGAVVWAGIRIGLLAERAEGSRLPAALTAYGLFFLLYTPIAVNFRLFPAAMLLWVCVGAAALLAQRSGVRPAGGARLDAVAQDSPARSRTSASSLSIARTETDSERTLSPGPPRAMS